jgi:ABC-type lipoprotein release transport system permease subunit
MAASLLGLRFLLLNPVPGKPEGEGYLVDETPAIYMSPYLVARDMWTLDEARIAKLQKYGITNNLVSEAHKSAQEQLDKASEYLREYRYDEFISAARSAWSLESRAYPAVRSTADDVVKGIIFYMALLLPFSFFLERLLIGHPDLKWQLLGTGGIFLGIFAVLYVVHPAFALTPTSIVILLAFIILALGCLVTSIIVTKFEEQMKTVKYEQTGVHTADVGRLSASGAAFSLGVSNMRRRKTRTILTCLTLILLTFTVMSFTSVVQAVRANKILIPKLSPYNGVLIRDKTWLPIGAITYYQMATEFGEQDKVAGRAWYFSTEIGKQSFVDVSRGTKDYMATAMLGMTPQEADITQPQQYLVEGSRWFQPGDENACILPDGVAKALGVTAPDIGKVSVSVFGNQMQVIGILSSSRFKSAQDLDGEVLTPVDFLVMQQQLAQQQVEESRGRSMKGGEMQEYIHLVPDAVIIVPFQFAMDHNATLRSVAIATPTDEAATDVLNKLITRVELNLYAGVGGKTYLCSAVAATGFSGMSNVLIPILIAAAIVLNTMLGSVYERVKEIYIYSSLGLAPNHVAALFIAEASVYAVLGAIAGYLVGQSAAKIVTVFHLSSSLNLNYSSLSAVATTLVIMATVLLSVMYPARRASDIAMPGIERRWSLPEPEGDLLRMKLPFTVTGDQALGVNMYLREFFMAHTDYSLGQFSTADIEMSRKDFEKGTGFSLSSMVWLAPYDLGVSERLAVETVPTDDPEIFTIEAVILRQSGDDASWMRVTRNFINIIRKQYLLWRTFPAAQKDEYGRNALALLEGRYVEEEAHAPKLEEM